MKALALLGALLAACSHGEARPGPITAAAPTGAGPAEKANPDGGSPGDSATATGASAKERTASGGAQEPRVAGDEIGRGSPPASTSQERGPGKEKIKGVEFLALPPSDKPLVTIALRFKGGAADDPAGNAGATLLAARIMSEGGTKSLDAKQLQQALFPIATDIVARVDKEETTFFATVHKDNLDKLVPILVDVVGNPRWEAREFVRLRDAQVLDVSRRLRQGDDENLGKEALGELMYRDHPYGRTSVGHVSDLHSITLEDLQQQAEDLFTLDRLTVGISGGYPKDLPDRLATALDALPNRGAAVAQIPPARPNPHPRFRLVEKPAEATAISCGMPWALSHKDPDWPAISVARSAIGEHRQFNGRLMQRLREQRGLNYGDYAYIEHFQQQGGDASTAQNFRARHQQDFTIWLRPVQNENRLFALRAALYEIQRSLREEPFSPEEVEQTKGFLDGYLLLYDQTDARKLGYALDDDFLGMGKFLEQWRASLRSVTADQVNAAWRKWMKPEELQCVLVGPGMEEAKKTILADAGTPMHYQKDAQGNVPQKPAALLETDRAVDRTSFGAKDPQDVEILPIDKMFE
ncbi:MAG: insulinase family protein [Deltaproteobacteria bacterium]|nr:MAG: insulinase family protein [Deltaproteobacteria bacterium]